MRPSRSLCTASFLVALAWPEVSRAQLPQQPLQTEGRIDAIFAHTTGFEGALGITVPGGIYVRSGLVAGLGAGRHGVEGRTDFISRFSLDPFRQSRWVPAVELGLGGGARVSVILRRGINARR